MRCMYKIRSVGLQTDAYGPMRDHCSEQKIAQFSTHGLTKEHAYVSTQNSGQVPLYTEMI